MSSVLNDDIDYEPLIECFLIDLKKYNIEIENKDIHWRGFGHQGDGLSFDFKLINLIDTIKFLKAIEIDNAENIDYIINNHFEAFDIYTSKNPFGNAYCHERTRNININYQYKTEQEWDIFINKSKQFISDWYINKCQEFYKLLEDYYIEEREEDDDLEREEWDDEITISDRIDAMIDPEMNIYKIIEMIRDAKTVSFTKEGEAELIDKFAENFDKEYLIIKKDT